MVAFLILMKARWSHADDVDIQTNRKRLDKATDDFESAVGKFVAKRQKKAETAEALYMAKLNACFETKSFIDYLNDANVRRDLFVINKVRGAVIVE